VVAAIGGATKFGISRVLALATLDYALNPRGNHDKRG
jgi:hypothetical protein